MAKVKWLARSASANGVIEPGTEMEMETREANLLAKSGYVEILESPKKVSKKETEEE